MGEFEGKTTADQKYPNGLVGQDVFGKCGKNISTILKTFGKIFSCLMRQKMNLLESLNPVTAVVKVTVNDRNINSALYHKIPTVNVQPSVMA